MTHLQKIRRLLLTALSVSFMATLPQLVHAQSNYRVAPQINNFTINAEQPLDPGNDISFSLEGTPRGQASVRINGINKNINLREVSAGVYQGAYTLNRRDRLGKQPTARATLRLRGISTIRSQAFSPTVASVPQYGQPVIERFGVTPVARIEPGAELRFGATGSPGGRALLTIDGVVQNVAMPEVRPGRYEGAYTIRRNDNFPASLNIRWHSKPMVRWCAPGSTRLCWWTRVRQPSRTLRRVTTKSLAATRSRCRPPLTTWAA
ncbi:MAG: hypothetical protein WBK51_00855 [Polaromonas sp.]